MQLIIHLTESQNRSHIFCTHESSQALWPSAVLHTSVHCMAMLLTWAFIKYYLSWLTFLIFNAVHHYEQLVALKRGFKLFPIMNTTDFFTCHIIHGNELDCYFIRHMLFAVTGIAFLYATLLFAQPFLAHFTCGLWQPWHLLFMSDCVNQSLAWTDRNGAYVKMQKAITGLNLARIAPL